MKIVVSFARSPKAETYKRALKRVDGFDVEILDAHSAAAPPPGGWRELIGSADGLLLTGGADVEPRRYGEAEDPTAGVYTTPERDAMEWELLAAARAARRPVFAICRGHQVVNAFLGGTLWQDLGQLGAEVGRAHDPDESDRRRLAHGLEVRNDSRRLAELLRAFAPIEVNSLHHQAVRDLAEGLEVAATSSDGVIEAMAIRDPSWWLWAVQWHPEELTEPGDHPAHGALFRGFLEACAEVR
ncbi:MAG: gamma-glutamyl-gamma-aminobutyrate hydrolase family protein [Thermoanaerobaculia bacterium]|nr:gamma-glutamyl-gamma-aminobutyrate hydrolase family protein [Thermoanaerobaculia bacterium]